MPILNVVAWANLRQRLERVVGRRNWAQKSRALVWGQMRELNQPKARECRMVNLDSACTRGFGLAVFAMHHFQATCRMLPNAGWLENKLPEVTGILVQITSRAMGLIGSATVRGRASQVLTGGNVGANARPAGIRGRGHLHQAEAWPTIPVPRADPARLCRSLSGTGNHTFRTSTACQPRD